MLLGTITGGSLYALLRKSVRNRGWEDTVEHVPEKSHRFSEKDMRTARIRERGPIGLIGALFSSTAQPDGTGRTRPLLDPPAGRRRARRLKYEATIVVRDRRQHAHRNQRPEADLRLDLVDRAAGHPARPGAACRDRLVADALRGQRASDGLGAASSPHGVIAAGWFGWRPLLRMAEPNFWSLNALAIQPGYAFFREAHPPSAPSHARRGCERHDARAACEPMSAAAAAISGPSSRRDRSRTGRHRAGSGRRPTS